MTNFAAQEINIVYSGWSKVFVKNNADNMEIKNRRQRNADFFTYYNVRVKPWFL
jgi:hypothetical protein